MNKLNKKKRFNNNKVISNRKIAFRIKNRKTLLFLTNNKKKFLKKKALKLLRLKILTKTLKLSNPKNHL